MKSLLVTALLFSLIIISNNCSQTGSNTISERESRKKDQSIIIKNSILNPQIEFDRSRVLSGVEQDLFVLVKLNVPDSVVNNNAVRTDLTLSMVIDRSGSMSGDKLSYVKEAANHVVDNLSARDKLGIVEYDDKVNTLWPLRKVESAEMVKNLISSLSARGSTNLYGGLAEGVKQVQNAYYSDNINRVILLSDGLANQGVTDPNEISRRVAEASRAGITVSTIGVGVNYNEDLMQSIAENGRGNYYFIEDPTQMTSIFTEELNSMFKTVAKDLKMTFKQSETINSVEVIGYKSTTVGDSIKIDAANMYSGENKMILLKVKLKPLTDGRQSVGVFNLNYYDCLQSKYVNYKVDLKTFASSDKGIVDSSISSEVAAEAEIIKADEEHETFVKQYENGEKDKAESNIDALLGSLQKKNQYLNNKKLEKKIEALSIEKDEIKKAEQNQHLKKVYLKKMKQKLYYSKKGKRGKFVLQSGDKSYEVKRLQTALTRSGQYSGSIDGIFTKDVTEAVMKFQKDKALECDGIAGPKTLKLLGLY